VAGSGAEGDAKSVEPNVCSKLKANTPPMSAMGGTPTFAPLHFPETVGDASVEKFDFYFALLSLLLGLALTELAGGIATALKVKSRIAIGWLTPLTALVICLDIASFWPILWALRPHVELDMPHVLVGIGLCLTYYIAASLAFPDDMTEVESLDRWFFDYRRFSLGGTLLVSITFTALETYLNPERLAGLDLLGLIWVYKGWIMYLGLLACAIVSRSKLVCGAALASIIALYPLIYLL